MSKPPAEALLPPTQDDEEDDDDDDREEAEQEAEEEEEDEGEEEEEGGEARIASAEERIAKGVGARAATDEEIDARETDVSGYDAAEPMVAPSSPTPRWIPALILLATAVGVILFVRYRGREVKHVAPIETAMTSASVAPPEEPRLPVLSTAEPLDDRTLDDASVLDFEAAKSERKEAVIALEKRDYAKALELATQATQHDPQEAESWLILGATYIYRGDYLASRQAFKSCLDVAKIGRRDQCEALLH